MDFVFFIPLPQYYEETGAEFEASLDSSWYYDGRVVLLFSILVKTGTAGPKECYCTWCSMIDCLYDHMGR